MFVLGMDCLPGELSSSCNVHSWSRTDRRHAHARILRTNSGVACGGSQITRRMAHDSSRVSGTRFTLMCIRTAGWTEGNRLPAGARPARARRAARSAFSSPSRSATCRNLPARASGFREPDGDGLFAAGDASAGAAAAQCAALAFVHRALHLLRCFPTVLGHCE